MKTAYSTAEEKARENSQRYSITGHPRLRKDMHELTTNKYRTINVFNTAGGEELYDMAVVSFNTWQGMEYKGGEH